MGLDLFSIMDRAGIILKLNHEWVNLNRPLLFLEKENILNFRHPEAQDRTKAALRDLGKPAWK